MTMEKRTKENPWKLKTPPQTSDYEMHKAEKDGKEIIVCTVGSTADVPRRIRLVVGMD